MKKSPFFHLLLLVAFLFNSLITVPVSAQELVLPKPGVMLRLSPPVNPAMLKGIKVDVNNPFKFEFVLDIGETRDNRQQTEDLKEESTRLIKYFLASLTIPERDLWVNLSPYEKDRVIPDSFGTTEMGRDLLAQDYILKQVTASLIYPEDEIGRRFWKRVYEKAAERYKTTNIPVNTFNKVWIVPEKAVVYENSKAGTAYVVESKLKVMLESDYLSLSKNTPTGGHVQEGTTRKVSPSTLPSDQGMKVKATQGVNRSTDELSQLGSQIVREIVIPELTKEVNEGKNFAQLRQVYNSLILATWYKKKVKDSILSKVYADRSKVQGVNIDNPQDKQKIYQQYLEAFKKGVYNYIKEDVDPISQERIPRKYFSGGFTAGKIYMDRAMTVTNNVSDLPVVGIEKLSVIDAQVRVSSADQAMFSGGGNRKVFWTRARKQAWGRFVDRYIKEPFDKYIKEPALDLADRYAEKYGARTKKYIRRGVIFTGVIALSWGSLWFYGRSLVRNGFLSNPTVQYQLDINSEEMLSDNTIFMRRVGAGTLGKFDDKRAIRKYLSKFTPEQRHRIIEALEQFVKANEKDQLNDTHVLNILRQLFDYDRGADVFNVFHLFEVLDYGYPRYNASGYDFTNQISAVQAKQLWEAILRANGQNIRKNDNYEDYFKHIYYQHHLEMFEGLVRANIPFSAKMSYVDMTKSMPESSGNGVTLVKFVEVRKVSVERTDALIRSFPADYWRGDEHKTRAVRLMLRLFNLTETLYQGRLPSIEENMAQPEGGFGKLFLSLSQLSLNQYADFTESFIERVRQVGNLESLHYIEGGKHEWKFFKGWTWGQLVEFAEGLKGLGPNQGEYIFLLEQAGITISPQLPRIIADPQQGEVFLRKMLTNWRLIERRTHVPVKDIKGKSKSAQTRWVVNIKNYDDYLAAVAMWRLTSPVQHSPTSDANIFDVQTDGFSFENAPWSELIRISSAAKVAYEFDRRLKQALSERYNQISYRPVASSADFIDSLGMTGFLLNMYRNNPNQDLYFAYVESLRNSDWKAYIKDVPREALEGLIAFLDVVSKQDKEEALAAFMSVNFPEFTDPVKMANLASVEQMRTKLNEVSTVLGDSFIITIMENFINTHPVSGKNIQDLLKVAYAWRVQLPSDNKDVNELYGLAGYFIANHIYAYVQEHEVTDEEQVIASLRNMGLVITQDDAAKTKATKFKKLATYVYNGNWSRVTSKATGAVVSNDTDTGNVTVAPSNDIKLPQGFKAYQISSNGKSVARLFVGSKEAVGVSLDFDVGFKQGGVSIGSFAAAHPELRVVMSLPVGFTTGLGKPTGFASERGVIKNWLMSMDREHGLAVVFKNGSMRIFDKRNLKTDDLYLDPSENKDPGRSLDLRKLGDFAIYRGIIASQKLSTTENMLLIDNEGVNLINDGPDARRFLVEFSDGSVGVFNMDIKVSTAQATKIAKEIQLASGGRIIKAMYADTGYYDHFTVIDDQGKPSVLGHADHDASSNRATFYARPQENDSGKSSAQDGGKKDEAMLADPLGGIDLNAERLGLEVRNAGEGIRLNLDPKILVQLQNAPGFTPVVIGIRPLDSLPVFLGLS